MPSTSFARSRPDARFALLWIASGCLAACSVINHFDELKSDISGGAGTSATGGVGGTATSGAGGDGQSGGAGPAGTGGASGTSGSATGGSSGMGTGGALGPVDAGPDALVLKPLSCAEVTNSRHKIDDFSTATGDHLVNDRFFLRQMVSGNTARLIAQVGGNTGGYYLYYVSDNGKTGGPTFIDTPQGRVLEVHTLPAIPALGTGPQMAAFAITNSGSQQFVMHLYNDAVQENGPSSTVPLTTPGTLGTSGQIEGSFAPDGKGKIGIFASYVPSAGKNRAAYGLFAAPTAVSLTPLFDSVDSNDTRPSTSFRVADATSGTSYGFFGEFGVLKAQVQVMQNDTGASMAPRDIKPAVNMAGVGEFVLNAGLNSTGKLNVAAARTDMTSGAFSLLLGQFGANEAFTFTDDKLNLGNQATSLTEIPFGSIPGFLEDNLIFAGPTGNARTQMAILGLDVQGRKRLEANLFTTTAKVTNAAIAPRGTIGGVAGRYHLVWSQTIVDANGMNGYDELWYAQISCL